MPRPYSNTNQQSTALSIVDHGGINASPLTGATAPASSCGGGGNVTRQRCPPPPDLRHSAGRTRHARPCGCARVTCTPARERAGVSRCGLQVGESHDLLCGRGRYNADPRHRGRRQQHRCCPQTAGRQSETPSASTATSKLLPRVWRGRVADTALAGKLTGRLAAAAAVASQ